MSPPDVVGTKWIAIFRETESDGTARDCVKHLDRTFGEVIGDELFPTQAEAQIYAGDLYGLDSPDWRDGEPEAVQR